MASFRDMILGKPKTGGGFSPLSQAHRDRQALFGMFWNYYRGHHRKPLTIRQGATDDNVILNLSKRVVNKGVQFLFGKAIDFEINGSDERTREEQYLDAAWGTDEQKHTWLQQAGINGSVTGTAVARLYEPVPGVGFNPPRMVVIDPMLLDVVSADDDVTDIRSYRIVWKSGDTWKRHRFDVQDNGEWTIAEEVARTNNVDWQIENETLWPFPFAPIVTCQNLPAPNDFWGMSDLEEADINDAINFTASNIARILKFHAHPKTIGTGFAFNQLQNTAVDEFWTIPNEAAKVFNLEMQSDLSSAYNYLRLLRSTYAKVTGVPELDPENVNVGALSGFALRILYGDLLEATNTKRNTYGMFLSEINTRLLAIGNQAQYGSVVVRNVWQDPLPSNNLEQAQTLQIDRNNGLSMGTYLTRRGYEVEREAELRDAETQQRATLGEELLRQFESGVQV